MRERGDRSLDDGKPSPSSSLLRSAGRLGRKLLRKLFRILEVRSPRLPTRKYGDLRRDPRFMELYDASAPYTVTSPERMFALYRSVRHVVSHGVPGAIAECGVLRGGSAMLAALALLELDATDRELWLYDTFAGMTEPGPRDRSDFEGAPHPTWERRQEEDHNRWGYAPLEEVRRNLRSTGYPEGRVRYVEGRVEETLPDHAPDRLAVLRLDTDWYRSTRHELRHLYPRLAPGGVLIVDDYGHWRGAREAVEEYLEERGEPILLHRVDYTGRVGVKPRGGRPGQ